MSSIIAFRTGQLPAVKLNRSQPIALVLTQDSANRTCRCIGLDYKVTGEIRQQQHTLTAHSLA